MKNVAMALWTAILLAVIECVLCIAAELIVYLIEGAFTSYSSGVEGVSVPILILSDGLTTFLGRFYFGFIPATTLVLIVCRFSSRMLLWPTIGIINVASLIIMCVVWEGHFHFLARLQFITRPLYQNIMYFLLISCFFSPLLLSKIKMWGNILSLEKKQ